MDEARLRTMLAGFRERKILVVGDFYLDAYWLVDKTKSTLSLETPWHTNPVVEQRYSPGAAGTVTNNLAALEVGEIYTLGVIGEDGFGSTLLERLEANGCITDFMISTAQIGLHRPILNLSIVDMKGLKRKDLDLISRINL